MKAALLIPIYEPGAEVLPFLKTFKEGDFDAFLVVNDGSKSDYDPVFESIQQETVFDVVGYSENKGKGFALKTGYAKLLELNPDLDYIITADGDGQHTYEDILKVKQVAEESGDSLVLGQRDFSSKEIPLRSRFGNYFSAWYFKLATKKKVGDTQTGLRAIPSSLFELALQTKGSRYEYEMSFLMDASREADVKLVPISTLYEAKNPTSHFRPIRDSLRIYRSPILYGIASLGSWGIDLLLFYLLSTYVFAFSPEAQVFASSWIARVVSGLFNFFFLNFVAFQNYGGLGKKALKYALLWVINIAISSVLTYLFEFLPLGLTFIKFIIDTVIAIANYFINLGWVFARKKKKEKQRG